jgi:hypothetical protein
MGGGPLAETVRFAWMNDGYTVFDARGRREPSHYRLTPLKGDWYITQRAEPGGVDYGLARRVGEQMYVYSVQCADLSDQDRVRLGLSLTGDGACMIGSMSQLHAAMSLVATHPLRAEGYYEVIPPTRP